MNGQIFTQIVLGVIGLAFAILSAVLVPYIKAKIGEVEYDRFVDFIFKAVKAANQIYTPEQWQTKKNYVKELVQDYLKENANINLTDEQIDAIIEGFVNEAKNALK